MGKQRKAPKGCYWRGETLWGRVQVAGQEYKWSLRTSDAATARRLRQEGKAKYVAGAFHGISTHSFEDVVLEWSEHIITQVGERTHQRYASSLKQIKPELIHLDIAEINKAVILAIIKRRRTDGVSTATIRRDLTALSSVLEFAEDHDYREGNPALDRLRKLKERRDPIVLPEIAHIKRVADRAPGALSQMTLAALATGCRLNELVTAERRNLDHQNRQLLVKGKGNKLRAIELDEKTYAMLNALPIWAGGKWLFWHSEGDQFKDVSSTFRYLVRAELKSAQKTAQARGEKEPDFRRFTFHHLRHRHAVDWLKSGKSLYDLQHRLGHTSVKTTEIYLAFLTAEEVRAVKAGSAQKAAHIERFEETKTG